MSGGAPATYAIGVLVLWLGGLPLGDSVWRGNGELHTLLETACTLLAFLAGAMSLGRYYTEKTTNFLLLGSGFLGAALLDKFPPPSLLRSWPARLPPRSPL